MLSIREPLVIQRRQPELAGPGRPRPERRPSGRAKKDPGSLGKSRGYRKEVVEGTSTLDIPARRGEPHRNAFQFFKPANVYMSNMHAKQHATSAKKQPVTLCSSRPWGAARSPRDKHLHSCCILQNTHRFLSPIPAGEAKGGGTKRLEMAGREFLQEGNQEVLKRVISIR